MEKQRFSEQRFHDDIENIFLKGMFLDYGYSLENKNDYHSFFIGKHPFVVRDNAIFDNVCDHRQALIHPLGYGNQKFVCGYHGKDQSHAKQFPSYNYNNLMFFGEKDPEIISLLEKYNVKTNDHFYHYEILCKCNWKIYIENVLERLHVPTVHGPSQDIIKPFLPFVDLYDIEYTRHGKHSIEVQKSTPTERFKKYIKEWKWEHLYIFPNLCIANISNVVTSFSYFIPVKHNEINLVIDCFYNNEVELDHRFTDIIKESAKKFTIAIINEDVPFMESCQIGKTAKPESDYRLEDLEERVKWFLENSV